MERPVQGYTPHLVILLGILVGVLPTVILPSGAGALTVVGLFAKILAGIVGFSIVAIGVHCYRTENDRPAILTGLTTGGLVVLGAVAGFHNESDMSLVPTWAWWLAVIFVLGLAHQSTSRIVNDRM